MVYFAYGSNLGVPRLRKRCPSVVSGRPALLKGWQIVFNKKSSDGSSKANIRPRESAAVWGVVFDIRPDELEGLRKAEGFPTHYEERTVVVVSADEEIKAVAYVACPNRVATHPVPPYDWYLEHVLRGAGACDLPDAYIAALAATDVQTDPDSARTARERSVWIPGPA